MAEVKVLIEGYLTSNLNGKYRASSCLIKDGKNIIISDPGVGNQKEITDALKKEGLKIEDIDFVFITHSHLDHYRNIGIFANAKTIEYWGIWNVEGEVKDFSEQFSKDITLIKTPGHNYDNLTMLVKTKKGVVAICGDVFWKEEHPKNDPYATDLKKLEESRKLILEKADFIVPGHGDMFRVKK